MFQTWPVKIIRIAASSRPVFVLGKERGQRQHDPRHEPQDRNALQNVDERQHHAIGVADPGCHVSIDEREKKRDGEGDIPRQSEKNA